MPLFFQNSKDQDATHIVILLLLVQNARWQRHLKRRPCNTLHQSIHDEAPDGHGEVAAAPTPESSIADHDVQPRHLDVDKPSVLALGALGVAEGALAEAVGQGVDPPYVAEIEGGGEDVDARGVGLEVGVVEALRRLRHLERVGAEVLYRLQGLGGRSRGGE